MSETPLRVSGVLAVISPQSFLQHTGPGYCQCSRPIQRMYQQQNRVEKIYAATGRGALNRVHREDSSTWSEFAAEGQQTAK